MKNIVNANIGKRLLSMILDGVFFGFLWFILMTYAMSPIANAAFHYGDKMDLGYKYQTASHLYMYVQIESDGSEVPIEVKDYESKISDKLDATFVATYNLKFDTYEEYLRHTLYYYTSYLTGNDIEVPDSSSGHIYDIVEDNFVSPTFETPVEISDGVFMNPKDLYTVYWFNVSVLKLPTIAENASTNEESLFEYEVDGDVINYNKLGVLKTDVSQEDAIKFAKLSLMTATKEFYYMPFYQNLMNELKWIQAFMILVPYVFVYALIYILFPLLLPNGKTLGKAALHVGLISSKGYKATRPQILLRQLFLFVMIALSTFIVGVGITSLATLGLCVVAIIVVELCNKLNKGPHDFIASTMLIDEKKSVFFANQKEEDLANKKVDESVAKHRSVKVENKHLIQVGDTIVDAKTKAEFEQAKTTKKHAKRK